MLYVEHRFRAGGAKITAALAVLLCGLLVALLLSVLEKVRMRAALTQSINTLKCISLACHNFYDENKRLPFNGPGKSVEGVVYFRNAGANINSSGSWGWQIVPYIDSHPIFPNPEKAPGRLTCFPCSGRARPVVTSEAGFFLNNYTSHGRNCRFSESIKTFPSRDAR